MQPSTIAAVWLRYMAIQVNFPYMCIWIDTFYHCI